ncbi:hypothetical protein [Butyrivibrio sp. JL13D10]|uniref:hypothetical protein n=1 Tax=Butyrivibrio sp. JL13D10 TaxID=3236815 RepID=UPI0038B47480
MREKFGNSKFAAILLLCLLSIVPVCAGTVIFFSTHRELAYKYKSYHTAKIKYLQGDYRKAAAILKRCGDFRDAEHLREKYSYKVGEECFAEEEYSDAVEFFLAAYNYKDAPEMINECNYRLACKEFEQKHYYRAQLFFEKLGDYKDSARMNLESQYQYVLANPEITYSDTQTYISNLMAADYKDSRELFEKLQELAVEILVISNKEKISIFDYGVNPIKNNKMLYVHFHITNAEPDKEYKLKVIAKFPGGDIYEDDVVVSLDQYWFCFYEPWQMRSAEGKVEFTILDENGKVLAEKSRRLEKDHR